MSKRLIDELRVKYRGLDKRERSGSPRAAIRLFCIECMGGALYAVEGCTATRCPLYRHRSGHRPVTADSDNP